MAKQPLKSITEGAVTDARQLLSLLKQHDYDLAGFCEDLTETNLTGSVKSLQAVASSTRQAGFPFVVSYRPRSEPRRTVGDEDQEDQVDIVSELKKGTSSIHAPECSMPQLE